MAPKVLVVLTSHDTMPGHGPTGWYLPEFAHPWEVLHKKTELTIASPNGGESPLDPASVTASTDDVSVSFLKEQTDLWKKTEKLSEVAKRADEFDAIFYVGGHGPMFDLVNDPTSIALIETFSNAKKPVAAVCHGPCVLLKAKTPSGESILAGAEATGFSNAEEDMMNLSQYMPFMLETELEKQTGGHYVKAAEAWAPKVVVAKAAGSGAPLITGQNPASATGVGEAILKALGL